MVEAGNSSRRRRQGRPSSTSSGSSQRTPSTYEEKRVAMTMTSFFPPSRLKPLQGAAPRWLGVLVPARSRSARRHGPRQHDQTIHAVARARRRGPDDSRAAPDRPGLQGCGTPSADPQVDIVYISATRPASPLALAAVEAEARPRREAPHRQRGPTARLLPPRELGFFATNDVDAVPATVRRPRTRHLSRDLGTIRLATADVGWRIDQTGQNRLLDPEQAGGVSLDMGVYGYWFTQFAIGVPRGSRCSGACRLPGSKSRPSSSLPALRAPRLGHDLFRRHQHGFGIHRRNEWQCHVHPTLRVSRPVRRESRGDERVGGLTAYRCGAGLADHCHRSVHPRRTDRVPCTRFDDTIELMRTIDEVRRQLQVS